MKLDQVYFKLGGKIAIECDTKNYKIQKIGSKIGELEYSIIMNDTDDKKFELCHSLSYVPENLKECETLVVNLNHLVSAKDIVEQGVGRMLFELGNNFFGCFFGYQSEDRIIEVDEQLNREVRTDIKNLDKLLGY